MVLTKSRKNKFPSYDEFIEATKEKKYKPIYLFIGLEDFLVDKCVDRIIHELLTTDTKAFNLDIVYGSKIDPRDVIAHATSFPMMNDRRVIVVKEFDQLLTDDLAKNIFSMYIMRPLESTCLVLVAENPDFRTKLFTDLKKSDAVYAFNPLYDNQVPTWIANYCREMGKEADLEACHLLQAYVGNSLRSIQNELQKLFTYLNERIRITPEDIADVVGISRGFTIFDLQNAIGKKDLNESLRIVKRMLETGETPQMMIVMLTRYLSLLWKIQDLLKRKISETEIPTILRISPYYLKNYTEAATLFSTAQIERSFNLLLEADIQLKSVSPDPYHLMEMLVFSLIRNPQPIDVMNL